MPKTAEKGFFKALLDLTKFRVTLAVSLSAFSGYVLFSHKVNWGLAIFFTGIFLIISASSALNQIQEWRFDKLMDRTKNRPIPGNLMSINQALAISVLLFVVSAIILFIGFPIIVFLGALFTAIWYNAVYTPLKRKSAFAVFPGALVGAMPPFIGWWAAGGPIYDDPILILAAVFFIGQIPHFWLLMQKYSRDYQQGGFPVIEEKFSKAQINRLIIVWMAAGIASALVFSAIVPLSAGARIIIAAYCVLFLVFIGRDILARIELQFRRNFLMLNMMYVLVMVIILVDYLVLGH